MTIFLNMQTLFELKNDRVITLSKKYQKDTPNYNFYINPKVGIKLYGAKVTEVSPNHVVFEYKKKDAINLYIL